MNKITTMLGVMLVLLSVTMPAMAHVAGPITAHATGSGSVSDSGKYISVSASAYRGNVQVWAGSDVIGENVLGDARADAGGINSKAGLVLGANTAANGDPISWSGADIGEISHSNAMSASDDHTEAHSGAFKTKDVLGTSAEARGIGESDPFAEAYTKTTGILGYVDLYTNALGADTAFASAESGSAGTTISGKADSEATGSYAAVGIGVIGDGAISNKAGNNAHAETKSGASASVTADTEATGNVAQAGTVIDTDDSSANADTWAWAVSFDKIATAWTRLTATVKSTD